MDSLIKIKEDVEKILIHSQAYPFNLDASELIHKWWTEKQSFIKAFDRGTFIRSKQPIKVTLSEDQRRRRFNEFMTILDDNHLLTTDFENFLRGNEDGFFDNRVLLPLPSRNISLGSKLSKSFKKFINHQESIRWAQDTASRYMQENKIEGYLYLSIDPRDFLTLSETNESWWSCHSLDGDYRSGNLSYMCDDVTMIAFLADDKEHHLKCLPEGMKWNSKKWRMLIHYNGSCAYFNRQYPYSSQDLINEVLSMFNKTFGVHFEHQHMGYKVLANDDGIQMHLPRNNLYRGGRIYDTADIVDASDYNGYCDIISSSTYAPMVMADSYKVYDDYISPSAGLYACTKQEEDEAFKKLFGIKIGKPVPCPCCGQVVVKREDSFLCSDCIAERDADTDFFLTCTDCHHRIYDEDEVYWYEGYALCKSCYNERMLEDLTTLEEDE